MQAATDSFDVERALREILSDGKEQPCIFDRLLERFETHSSRAAGSIYEIKRRDSKKAKGDGWESFCQFYLSTVMQYHRVWRWPEIPADVRQYLRLGSRVDNGIDLVAQETPHSGFIAVQCKYRQKILQTVTWTTLSTFVGLCSQTGPWLQHLVMTNCKGVSRKTGIPRTAKDRTLAYGTFKNMTRHQCTMVEPGTQSDYHRVAEYVIATTLTIPKTMEELREARIKALSAPKTP
jgi:hypothetical protein